MALGYGWRDVGRALGLPPGYTDVGDFPVAEKLRILSREIEPLDQESIERIALGNPKFDFKTGLSGPLQTPHLGH